MVLLLKFANFLLFQIKSENQGLKTAHLIQIMSQNQYTYKPRHSVGFRASQTLNGFTIAGPPSARGEITVRYTGKMRLLDANSSLHLEIPFEIRPCHQGFHSVPITLVSQ